MLPSHLNNNLTIPVLIHDYLARAIREAGFNHDPISGLVYDFTTLGGRAYVVIRNSSIRFSLGVSLYPLKGIEYLMATGSTIVLAQSLKKQFSPPLFTKAEVNFRVYHIAYSPLIHEYRVNTDNSDDWLIQYPEVD